MIVDQVTQMDFFRDKENDSKLMDSKFIFINLTSQYKFE